MNYLLHSTRTDFHRMCVLSAFFAAGWMSACNSAHAQGTASGPFTAHVVQPGPIVVIGDPNSPMPIDLDPNGLPWFKSITDDNLQIFGGGVLDFEEHIVNVGTEAWGDWHEEILGPPAGLPPASWTGSISLEVNGNPITFSSVGLGTQVLWLDNFSQPVLPGEVFTIRKQALVLPNSAGATGVELMRLLEYPTPVPEPASLALLAMSSLTLMGRRRRR